MVPEPCGHAEGRTQPRPAPAYRTGPTDFATVHVAIFRHPLGEVRQKQVAAIFPLTPPASVRLVAARHDGNTLTPTRSATQYSVAVVNRVHRRDRGGADGLDHFPHHPVAAKRSDGNLERVPPTRRAPRYLRLRLGCFHAVSAYCVIHSQMLIVVAVACLRVTTPGLMEGSKAAYVVKGELLVLLGNADLCSTAVRRVIRF
jgi:hypothetical protein